MNPELEEFLKQLRAQQAPGDAIRVADPQPKSRGLLDTLGMMTLGNLLTLGTADPRAPETRAAYDTALGIGADVAPGLGDVKAVGHDFPRDLAGGHPILAALDLASVVPGVGAVAGGLRRAAGPAADAATATRRLRHHSPSAGTISRLETARHGQGQIGAERFRKGSEGYLDRTYFYPEGREPELRFANVPFLDVDVDPSIIATPERTAEIFQDAMRASDDAGVFDEGVRLNRAEQAVQDAGFEGYETAAGMIAKFTDTPVPQNLAPAMTRAMHESPTGLGATFAQDGRNMAGSGEFAVAAKPGDDLTLPWEGEMTPEMISQLDLEDGQHIGTWVRAAKGEEVAGAGGEVVVLDAIQSFDNEADAIAAGMERGQDGIFHLEGDGRFIPTPHELLSPSTEEVISRGTQSADEFLGDLAGGGRQLPERPTTAVEAADARANFDKRNKANRAARDEAIIAGLNPEEAARFQRTDNLENVREAYSRLPTPETFAHAAIRGSAARGWYKGSAEAIRQAFPDGADSQRFAALLASQSPQKSVQENLQISLNSWANWVEAGRPTDSDAIIGLMDTTLEADLQNSVRALTASDESVRAGVPSLLSGPKVGPFYANLIGEIDPVVNDTHMARGFGTTARRVGTVGRGLAQTAMVRNAAKEFERITGTFVEPRELQEMAWSYIRGLTNAAGGASGQGRALEIVEQSFLEPNATFAGGLDLSQRIEDSASIGALMSEPRYAEVMRRIGVDPAGVPDIPPTGVPGLDPQSADINRLRDVAERIDEVRAGRPLYSVVPGAGLLGVASARERLQRERDRR